MSGPKKSDVIDQLNVAERAHASCAVRVATPKKSSINSILQKVDIDLKVISEMIPQAADRLDGISTDTRRVCSVRITQSATSLLEARKCLKEAENSSKIARNNLREATQAERTASITLGRADAKYDEAMRAVTVAAGSNLYDELDIVKDAEALYDQAAKQLEKAATAVKKAAIIAKEANEQAHNAGTACNTTSKQVNLAIAETADALKAEIDDKRIKEDNIREAKSGIRTAQETLQRCSDLSDNKHCAAELSDLQDRIHAVEKSVKNGISESMVAELSGIQQSSIELEGKLVLEIREREKQTSEAQSVIASLEADISSVAESLIKEWSDDTDALCSAREALAKAEQELAVNNIAEASETANNARMSLEAALESAAENVSADERRTATGGVIMQVLSELGFDVQYEPGNKTEPLRIAGQTPNADGKGDFDIEVPLDGELDFQVESPAGDTSCIEAVLSLQKRLAAKGVRWETTDWGHATQTVKNPVPSSPINTKEKEKTQQVQTQKETKRVSE